MSKTLTFDVSVAMVATDATKETTMTLERLLWNLQCGVYDLTDEQVDAALELAGMVECETDAWAARELIAELEAANG